jgi:NADH:ubiquinone reductase (H+-translocating)
MKHKVIVIGGGFAGIQLVRRLDEELFDVLLIDKINHHQFQPLFYQVATSQLEPSSISFPLRHIFRNKKNVQIRLAEVLKVDPTKNEINTTIGNFPYDFLVIAIGCKTNFFGNKMISKNSFSLKSTYDAISIRNHILQTFEKIISVKNDEKESLSNLIIVGGGPTGVELAGAFAEIKKNVLPKDFRGIDFSEYRIILIEGSKDTLNNMSQSAKINSRKYLKNMGVDLITETFVNNYDGDILTLSSGKIIRSNTLIWAAGVIGNSIDGIPESSIGPGNRIKVDRINKVVGSENIFAVGDIAFMETPKYPRGHPQVANVAINQAKRLTKNLKKIISGKKPVIYEYSDLGTMATIGWKKAVIDFPFISFKGYFAWLIWMFLHLMLILSIKNKLIIFINWAWAYISKNTSLRLILAEGTKIVNGER